MAEIVIRSNVQPCFALKNETMPELSLETLLAIGFVDVAIWRSSGEDIDYHLEGERAKANQALLDDPNALYAFTIEEAVKYIGKTTRSVRRRFAGYRKPGKTQTTNIRCNGKIKEALSAGAKVHVFIFSPISNLRYLDFEINLAAGLEDSLIKAFDPPWNGREKTLNGRENGKPLSEDTEREEAQEELDIKTTHVAEPDVTPIIQEIEPLATFEIRLNQTYYNQGWINPGVRASQHLGTDGEPIQILFDDGAEPVCSKINRTAIASGAVRILGNNASIAKWFQTHFNFGDIVQAQVLDANHILLISIRR